MIRYPAGGGGHENATLAGALRQAHCWACRYRRKRREVTLTRIDCGTGATPTDVDQRFTDTFAYKDLKLTFTFSCYLIKHGDEYMVWDTGFAPGTNPNAPKVGIVDRLKELKVAPEQVKYVGISHFHGDHTGQLAPFPKATLLIGKGDWDQITAPTPMQGANVAGFKSWIDERRESSRCRGQGRVRRRHVVIARHAGSHAGPQRPAGQAEGMGPVLLTGDLVHFRENYESGGVPHFNFDRAATVASIERMKQIAANLKATVVIQHDMRDIGKLRLGGVFAIAAVVDHFSDAVVQNPIVGKTSKNPALRNGTRRTWTGCRASSSCEPCGSARSRAGRSNTRPQSRVKLSWVLRRRIVTSRSRQKNSTRSRPSLGAPLTSSKCLSARRKKSLPPAKRGLRRAGPFHLMRGKR